MPRPGPRPYECVRRAWHSERHQPMRGSIIQQILRLANETHSTATKKNKEWQAKIITVILKAEEIMYSKANSESEYTTPETLWDRVNDAVNTIIRRDESTETGELLPPCVEAALNLGCYPVRASRSQRHSNPRTYLPPRAPESASTAPRILDKVSAEQRCPQLSPVQSGGQFARIATDVNSNISVSQANRHGYSSSHDQLMRTEANTPPNSGQVYPLYYGVHYQNSESQTGSPFQENIASDTIIVGRPIGTSILEAAERSSLQNFFSSSDVDVGGTRIGQQDIRHTHEKSFVKECDLSLRLGLFSDPCMQVVKNSTCETKDVGPSRSQETALWRMKVTIWEQKCESVRPHLEATQKINIFAGNQGPYLLIEEMGQDGESREHLCVLRNGGSLLEGNWIIAGAQDMGQGWDLGARVMHVFVVRYTLVIRCSSSMFKEPFEAIVVIGGSLLCSQRGIPQPQCFVGSSSSA